MKFFFPKPRREYHHDTKNLLTQQISRFNQTHYTLYHTVRSLGCFCLSGFKGNFDELASW
ncbi:CLUMA_CG003528, isoform A [Clunio marinus]|uniref:CLUMA_CG003528, isoform A n=1 Tax=Clunio marinus TaxID=568069 RepID=A0A1J1HNV3_9DIPT|nr:CLUMA_CG003528, isoform A [Clunio marinus]